MKFTLSHPKGEATITFDVFKEAEETVCGIYMLEGYLSLPPKQWLRVVRSTLSEFEDRARQAGCTEMRMSGRDWSSIATGYERIQGDAPNLLRKKL